MQEIQEMWVQSLDREDTLEEEMATHSSILTWRMSTDKGAWWATVHGVAKSQTPLSSQHFHFFQTLFTHLSKIGN